MSSSKEKEQASSPGRKPSFYGVSNDEMGTVRVPRLWTKEAKRLLVEYWEKYELWKKK